VCCCPPGRPGVLLPGLEVLSGALVLAIGIRLISRRAAVPAAGTHRHGDAGAHAHGPGGRPHPHALPAGGVTPRGLIAMGVSGGLVPCPEALGVLVVAVGVNRTVFGLGLIMSFSVGIAVVLMGLGVLLVRARHLAGRFERIGGRWTTALPLVSALVVSALGAGLLIQGVPAGISLR
jgi:nickel/cobalt transporter (NicO) family protein